MDTGVDIVEVDFGERAPQPARDTISRPLAEKKRGKSIVKEGLDVIWCGCIYHLTFVLIK